MDPKKKIKEKKRKIIGSSYSTHYSRYPNYRFYWVELIFYYYIIKNTKDKKIQKTDS